MTTIGLPYAGDLLVAHLAAYGLAMSLDAAGLPPTLRHDPDSLFFEPILEFDGKLTAAVAAVRDSASEAAEIAEADVEQGKRGNDRRSVIWARASFANDVSRASVLLRMRGELMSAAEARDQHVAVALMGGLGATAAWGSVALKPSQGATLFDGVLGNHTSDLVRGVIRPARAAAAEADAGTLESIWSGGLSTSQLDKTGWAPPGTAVDLVHQWLAVLGLSLLPVAHRIDGPSSTPACWTATGPRRDGVTLPLLATATSVARLRALIALRALVDLADGEPAVSPPARRPAVVLSSYGVREVVTFARATKRGSGTSVAFTFRRGRRIELR